MEASAVLPSFTHAPPAEAAGAAGIIAGAGLAATGAAMEAAAAGGTITLAEAMADVMPRAIKHSTKGPRGRRPWGGRCGRRRLGQASGYHLILKTEFLWLTADSNSTLEKCITIAENLASDQSTSACSLAIRF